MERTRHGLWWVVGSAGVFLFAAYRIPLLYSSIVFAGFGLFLLNHAQYMFGIYDDADQEDYNENGTRVILSVTVATIPTALCLCGVGVVAFVCEMAQHIVIFTQFFFLVGSIGQMLIIVSCMAIGVGTSIYSLALLLPSKRRARYQAAHPFIMD